MKRGSLRRWERFFLLCPRESGSPPKSELKAEAKADNKNSNRQGGETTPGINGLPPSLLEMIEPFLPLEAVWGVFGR
jgi:hypothetical protein